MMHDGAVRSARPQDAAAIAAIWAPIIRDTLVTFYPHPRSAEEVAAMIADRQGAGHAFLVAEAAGTLAGFASYSQFRTGPGYARTMEHSVILAPEARGRGLGAALMRRLEEHAAAAGHHGLIGAITAENAASRAFHRRLGFAEVGRIPGAGWKFGRFHDLVLVHKVPTAAQPASEPVRSAADPSP
ncbi:MAG: N-acetyltransferase family protein [Alkalilacustris sp.]